MEIAKEIRVNAPVDKVWPFISDVPSVISCFPGAEIVEAVSDSEYNAVIKVRIGPFAPQFKGTVTIEERDDSNHRLVVRAKGGDRRMGSSVSSVITISLTADSADSAIIHTVTDVQLTGRLAQFGKGIFEGVANRMVGAFAERLNQRIA